MAASMSAWTKPGAWALDAEEHDADAGVVKDDDNSSDVAPGDFPSLAAAAASKTTKKKKKAQTISLAEFTTGKPVSHGAAGRFASSASKGLTPGELLLLPTGPRERSAEELERSSGRGGFGYSYGARGRAAGEDSNPSRWGSARASDEPRRGGFGGSGGGLNRDLEPSRADEIDDWGAAKKSFVPERRERGGFLDSQSRADESDSWISNKSAAPPADGRRMGGGAGFGGPRERMGGFEMFNREGSNGGRADSDTWGRKKDFGESETWKRDEEISNGGRRRLVLQPRSSSLSDGNNGEQVQDDKYERSTENKSKSSNPFGQARPREEVLAEKGQDWKKIDEKLEALKIRDAAPEKSSFGNRGFRAANSSPRSPENRTEGAWRKPDGTVTSPSEDKVENTVPEN